MRRYIARRLILFPPTLLLASLAVFIVMRALPGDVTAAVLGGEGEALDPRIVSAIRAELGLEDPLPVQYVRWLWSVASGGFGGRSLETGEAIGRLVARQLPVTLQLTAYSLALALLFSIPLGLAAAAWQDRWPDRLIRFFSITGGALPGFWVAIVAMLALVYWFGWSPPLIYQSLREDPAEHLQAMALPAFTLALGLCGHLARLLRAALLDVFRLDFIRTARAKGLGPWPVLFRHALRAAWIPFLTLAGAQAGAMLSGAVVLEYIFGLPGLGRGMVQAAMARDYPVVQTLSVVLVGLALSLNLLVDLAYARLDPRISYDD